MNSLELVMAEQNLKGLLLHTLKDVYFAEHEILKTLPKMAQAAQSAELKEAFETHRAQTEQQIGRLADVFAQLNRRDFQEIDAMRTDINPGFVVKRFAREVFC